jgi:hypothetical protein
MKLATAPPGPPLVGPPTHCSIGGARRPRRQAWAAILGHRGLSQVMMIRWLDEARGGDLRLRSFSYRRVSALTRCA